MSLIPHLACPQCGEGLQIRSAEWSGILDADVLNGVLYCDRGLHEYTIDEGVPVLLPPDMSAEQKQVADVYSDKWRRIPGYGYDDAALEFQREWYLQKFGWRTVDRFREFLLGQERVLDAGCGLGRDVKFYAENTNGLVFGVDISDSILVANERLRHLPNVHLIRADMTRLPFRANYFDFISSDQALHHTPDTRDSFNRLVDHVKPRGQIAIYVYKKKSPAREYADDMMRSYTTEMSYDDCAAFSSACALFGRTVAKLNLDLQRSIYWNLFKCFWDDRYDVTTNVLINMDWYHPKYAWRHSLDEVLSWYEKAGLAIQSTDVSDSGISIRGCK